MHMQCGPTKHYCVPQSTTKYFIMMHPCLQQHEQLQCSTGNMGVQSAHTRFVFSALCCAVLCCTVMCCTVLCAVLCSVLCCAVQCVVMCCTVLCAVLCSVLCCAVQCFLLCWTQMQNTRSWRKSTLQPDALKFIYRGALLSIAF
jgi:hypothetical protein